MTAECLKFGVLYVLVFQVFSSRAFLLANETIGGCPLQALVDLSKSFAKLHNKNGPVSQDGVFYPADAIGWVGGVPYGCPCRTRVCLSLCCTRGECQQAFTARDEFFPIHDPKNTSKVDEHASVTHFWQFAWDICHATDRYVFEPDLQEDDQFLLLSNGSLLQPTLNYWRNYTDYCVAYLDNELKVYLCFDETPEDTLNTLKTSVLPIFPIGMLISVPFLMATFVVYMLIKELRNIHGMTLCAYVVCLIVAYLTLSSLQIVRQDSISDSTCAIYAYIVHFSFMASFFWLNVMCFDIWWTFGGFRSLHGSVKQRERKKFIMYSIYAWGCASVITGICMVMDLAPGIPTNMIRPEFGTGSCWFNSSIARAIYFYGPMGMTVLCNICLFILTALKIIRHKKDTARQLKGSDSRRHDDNKQWFNLYLKLFIVMGINWSTEIISWLFEDTLPRYVWYITDLTNTLQGVIIFIIFVWKDKIKRLLLKRFHCENSNFLSSRNSTSRSGYPNSSAASRTTCVTSGTAPLQEKVNPYADPYPRGKSTVTDDSDCI